MSGLTEAEAGHSQVAEAPHVAPVGEASPPAGPSPEARRQEIKEGTWPYLSAAAIDRGWQQAVNGGPSMMGRQVAFALAASLKRDPDDTYPTPPPSPYATTTPGASALLALAALAEHLPVQQRITLLNEAEGQPNPALKAQALLLLAPSLSGEKRHVTVRDAYESARTVEGAAERARLLTAMLPLLHTSTDTDLPSGIVAETLDLASAIENTEARLRGLTALAPYLPPTVRVALLLAALDTIAALPQPDGQAGALVALAPYLLGEVHHRALTVAAHIKEPAHRARVLTVLAQHLPARLQPRLRAAALEAIATIVSEEERAQALAAFAPHLEQVSEGEDTFPVLLERALALAVHMSRRDARAKALVGLQACLPRHLQGEALAAVNAIPDEHVRAQMLAELAPSLPPDLAVAALAIAHDIRQRDARFLALTSLGPRLPEKAAERTWLDALAVAVALPRQLERVLALCDLVPHLPTEELRHRTLVNALTTARSISTERARVRALSTLAPLLVGHEQILADALADAYTVGNPVEKVSALVALIPYLPDEPKAKTVEVALDGMGEITVEYRRARSLNSLVPDLSGEMLHRGVDIALDIADPYDRSTTLIALLSQLPQGEQADMLKHVWDAARDILDPYDRATALATLWPLATADMQPQIVRAVLDSVNEIDDDYDRASGVSVFAPLLTAEDMPSTLPSESQVLREALLAACQIDSSAARAEVLGSLITPWLGVHPATMAYALWCEALLSLSHRPIPQLLIDIAALTPILREIGGKVAVEEAAQAVVAARHW